MAVAGVACASAGPPEPRPVEMSYQPRRSGQKSKPEGAVAGEAEGGEAASSRSRTERRTAFFATAAADPKQYAAAIFEATRDETERIDHNDSLEASAQGAGSSRRRLRWRQPSRSCYTQPTGHTSEQWRARVARE